MRHASKIELGIIFLACMVAGLLLTSNHEEPTSRFFHHDAIAGSASSTGVLNNTTTQLNFTFTFSEYHEHDCQLAMPVGCDFDMRLYNPSNTLVASALARSSAGTNESMVYFNNGPSGTFKIQVLRYSGSGSFTVSVTEVQKIVIDSGNPHVQPFNANYNNTGLWKATYNRTPNPWGITNASFRSSPTSLRFTGAGIPIFDTPVAGGTIASPLFDLRGNYQYVLMLGYLLYPSIGLGSGSLEVQVNGTGGWNNLATLNPLATDWTRLQVNISSYKGSHVRFRLLLNGIGNAGYFYLDDFQINTIVPGTPAFSNPGLSPTIGNNYTTFHVQVNYTHPGNIFPGDIHVSVWDGFTPDVKTVPLGEVDLADWDLTNGKLYACDFQLFDVKDPYLYCASDQLVLPYALFLLPIRYLRPVTSEALSTASLPYMLDFEGGDVFYTINDPWYAAPAIESNSNGNYLAAGTSAGAIADNSLLARVGIATPWITVPQGLQTFIEFDLTFNVAIQNLVNAFKVNVTINGVSWITVAQYTSSTSGKQSVNITAYQGHVVGVRIFMESLVTLGIRSASFTLDNVSVAKRDLVAPVWVNPSLSAGQWLFGTVTIDMAVADVGFGVARVIVKVDSLVITEITSFTGNVARCSIETTRFTNGDHEIVFIIIDTSGNQNAYTFVVRIDNTPYWLYLAIIGAAIVFGLVAVKKRGVIAAGVQRKARKEEIPPASVANKILEITGVFRRISAADLAKKLGVANITPGTVLAYLRYMVAQGMLKGDLDGDVFTRVMSGKMKAILAGKEAAIIEYLRSRRHAPVARMIQDLHLEGLRTEALEDFIMGLVVARKISCYFEDGAIFCEDEEVTKVPEVTTVEDHVPAQVPSPGMESTARMAMEPRRGMPVESSTPPGRTSQLEGATIATEPEPAAAMPAKAPWTLADKKDDIIRLVSSKEHVSFEEIKKEFALTESSEDIEDFLFHLIKNGEINGLIEDDGFSRRDDADARKEQPVQLPATLASKKDDIISMLASKEHVSFQEIKQAFILEESIDEIEDFLFDLIKNKAIKGIIEEDGFSSRD
ncbi:MAG: hypothetical protein GYA24_13330 [Candidatus Lokiarchaeota archaeon]|nr:hypothetical protein [Candidatus Lokiarchaeota archaeon]